MSQPFSWAMSETVGNVLLLSTACPGLLIPWVILGISAVLSFVHGIFILFGIMGRKHLQCKSKKEAILDDVCLSQITAMQECEL